jgi:hypothetical protein
MITYSRSEPKGEAVFQELYSVKSQVLIVYQRKTDCLKTQGEWIL